jgi:protein ImuA
MRAIDRSTIERLQKEILRLQTPQQTDHPPSSIGLGAIESAFPSCVFPTGTTHELISITPEDVAATNGFISVMLGKIMQPGAYCIWIGAKKRLFPTALIAFGIRPERILFVDARRPKDTLWALEEALKCDALAGVVAEISELGFDESRRLQLVVERSRVTAFIHRHQPKMQNAVACVSRWKITPIASIVPDDMPGLGFPRWNVQLLKVRNGMPGEWQVQWSPDGLKYIGKEAIISPPSELRIA